MKLKKILIILSSILGGIILLILSLFIYFAASVSDSTNNTPKSVIENDYSLNQVLNREMTDALSQEEDITLDLSTCDLTEILYAAIKEIHINSVSFLGAYVTSDESSYTAEIPVKVYGVSSCLRVSFTLDIGSEGFKIVITDMRMGHLNADSFIVRKIVLSSSNRAKITASLKNMGIELSIDDSLGISMSQEQILSTLENTVTEEDTMRLLCLVVRLALSEDFISYDTNKSITVSIDTEGLLYDEAKEEAPYLLDYTKPVSKTEALLSTLSLEQVPAVFEYYTVGYEGLKDKEKAVIDELGYTHLEAGIRNTKASLEDIILESSSGLDPIESIKNKGVTLSITEGQLNSVFAALKFIGAGTAFTDGTKVSFISMESLSFELLDDALQCNMILNMNGKRLYISADADVTSEDSLKLDCDIKDIYVGNRKMSKDYIPDLCSYLSTVTEDEGWISVTDTVISLDFTEAIKEASSLSFITKFSLNEKIAVKEDTLELILSLK